jgi:pimeloyl-ACP methyl ester carboxylesterase
VAPAGLTYAWGGFADDLLAVVDALGGGPLLGLGHSKGGAALLLAEQRRPGTFRALYLYEPVVPPPDLGLVPGSNSLADGALRRRAEFPSYDAAYRNFAAKPPLEALDPSALRAYVDFGFEEQRDGSVRLKCRPEVESAVYRMGHEHHAFEHLDEVWCPVTVAVGHDEVGPARFAPDIVARLRAGRLEPHPDLGHFGPLEDPATIAAAVRAAFLAA